MTRTALIALIAAAASLTAIEAAAQTPAAPAAAAPATPQVNVTTVGANINITPRRVTFDRSRRNATVYVFNQGDTPITFDIAMVDRIMMSDGQIIAADDTASHPGSKAIADQLKSAKDMVLISPRRATLAAGKGQTVRLRLNALPDGAGGEYRSHLTVTTIPPRETGTTAEAAAGAAAPNQLSFQINAIYGISIPIIVRTADVQATAAIENVHVESVEPPGGGAKTPVLAFDLVRAGPNSLFGNIEVQTVGARKGADPVGVARGVGVYPEIDRRVVRIPLSHVPAAGEKLEVTFTDDDSSPGKVLAKATT